MSNADATKSTPLSSVDVAARERAQVLPARGESQSSFNHPTSRVLFTEPAIGNSTLDLLGLPSSSRPASS